jgi:hypothetical protein
MIDIVFMTEFMGVNDTEITDYEGLRLLGDEKMGDLIHALSNSTKPAASSGPGGKICASQINIFLILTILSTVAIFL